jgi:hypothetical protein
MSTIEERQHSEIGASGASRWVACPGSRRMSRGQPNRTTRYAAEGTVAHEIAAFSLNSKYRPEEVLGVIYHVAKHDGHPEEGQWDIEVDQEMVGGVHVYLDAIEAIKLEQRKERVLYVIDFKYGAGRPVNVKNNIQLKYYALGAMLSGKVGVEAEFDLSQMHPGMFGTADFVHRNYITYKRGDHTIPEAQPEIVVFGIVQPRCEHPDGPVRFDECHSLDLIEFADELVTAARATEDPNAPLAPGVPQCDWCPGAKVCPALREKGVEAAQRIFPILATGLQGAVVVSDIRPVQRTPEQVAADLVLADKAEAWIAATRGDAYAQADSGAKIPGFKLVEKQARRKWIGLPAARVDRIMRERALNADYILSPAELKSPKEVEDIIKEQTKGKERKLLRESVLTELASLYEAKSSGTVLVPESDKRPELKRLTAQEVFKLSN